MIAAIQMQTMDHSFLDKIRTGGKEEDTRTARKEVVRKLKGKQDTLPTHGELEDVLLYHKKRPFIQ